jgi:hypothetical protein
MATGPLASKMAGTDRRAADGSGMGVSRKVRGHGSAAEADTVK